MEDIHSAEVIELMPFAARRVIKCELQINRGPDKLIALEEFLAVVAGPRAGDASAAVYQGDLDDPFVLWAFMFVQGNVGYNYQLHSYMKVAEARALRDNELGFLGRLRRRFKGEYK